MKSIPEWKEQFLHARDLLEPTGEPLFSYRTEAHEFEGLQNCLKHWLGKWIPLQPFAAIAENNIYFPELFVLYASEWWKRCYDGGGWSWEPILNSLGVDASDWGQQQRTACVTKGLRRWGLQPHERRGLRYLGSIAFNGGLPLLLLADLSRGKIGQMLRQILALAMSGSASQADLVSWIKSQSEQLPRAYRQEEIYVLLAEVVSTSIRIQQDTHLQAGENVLAVLDNKDRRWRNRFPLPMEDGNARALVEQLMRDVVAVPSATVTNGLRVERYLESPDNAFWDLRAETLIPERVEQATLGQLFQLEAQSIPATASLFWHAGALNEQLAIRKLAGHEKFLVERRPLVTQGLSATCEQVMELVTATGSLSQAMLPRGSALDEDLPWIFAVEDSKARFIRQGSGAVSAAGALVVVPESWTTQLEPDVSCNHVGWLQDPIRSVYRLLGRARFISPDGQAFTVRTDRPDAQDDLLEWSGQRVWQAFESPTLAFRGQPQLFRRGWESHASTSSAEKVTWQTWGGNPAKGFQYGPSEARWLKEGEVRWRSRLVVLPREARETLLPGDSPNVGTIKLHHWGVSSAVCLTPGVDALFCAGDGVAEVALVWRDPQMPVPEHIELQLQWPHSRHAARIALPYPAVGVVVHDANNHTLKSNSVLVSSQMSGTRISIIFGNQTFAKLTFELTQVSKTQRLTVPSFSIRPPIGGHRAELRLIDYRSLVDELFGSVDATDAQVRLSLEVGKSSHRLLFSRHAGELLRDEHLRRVGLGRQHPWQNAVFESAALCALKLDEPSTEPIRLTPAYSQGVAVGDWHFDTEQRAAGPWLIYPAVDCPINFRPQIWRVGGAVQHDGTGIREALDTADQALRLQRLDAVIAQLADDFTSPEWEVVEDLVRHLQHLPLATLDLWRRFAHSGAGMAALAFRMSAVITPAFVARFANELPFMWELVTFDEWRKAIMAAIDQADAWYGEAAASLLASHLNKQREQWGSNTPAIRFMLEAAYCAAAQKNTKEVRMALNPAVDAHFKQQLCETDKCHLQDLLREHTEHDWPAALSYLFYPDCKEAGAKKLLVGQFRDNFKNSAINLPILLAYQAATNKSAIWLLKSDEIRHLRSYRAFDPVWFEQAYHCTLARCLSNSILTW